MSVTINGTTGIDAVQSGTIDLTTDVTGVLPSSNGGTATTVGYNCFKNRIINGAMMIDQRNAGASVNVPTTSQVWLTDRWTLQHTQASKYTGQQNAGAVTPPAGFTNYLGVTSASAYSVVTGDFFLLSQPIEANNMADLGWGGASSVPASLSFWVRSSLTGTFGGALENGTDRSFPFTYTINSANTWEYKTIVISAPSAGGTWGTGNNTGVYVRFGLGVGSTYSGTAGAWSSSRYFSATGATSLVGTSGATFYITGVQLEKGSTATSFDYRPYGTELQLCQRYYFKTNGGSNYQPYGAGFCQSSSTAHIYIKHPVDMRSQPTLGFANVGINYGTGSVTAVTGTTNFFAGLGSSLAILSTSAVLTVGQGVLLLNNNNASGYIEMTAEL